MRRVGVYCRVSTEEQAQGGVSLEVQQQRCLEAARGDAAEDIELYVDDGYSGTTMERPGLTRLLTDAPDLDAVYVWKIDRLARSVPDTATITRHLADADCGLASVTEAFDATTPWGRAMMYMLAVWAELMVGLLRENTAAALQQRVENGVAVGRIPYGYRGTDEAGVWEPDPETAVVVQRMFREYVEEGLSLRDIARRRNGEGLPRPSGRDSEWDATIVGKLIRNPAYLGRIPWHGQTYEGQHDALVDPATYEAAQRRQRRRARLHPRRRDRTLTHIFRCGLCGSYVQRVPTGTADHHYSYRCARRKKMPPEEQHESISSAHASSLACVWAWVRAELPRQQREATRAGTDARPPEVDRHAQELADCQARMRRNLEAYHDGAITREMLADENRPLRERIEELQAARARAEDHTDELARWCRLNVQALELLVESDDIDRQAALLDALIDRVELLPDRYLRIVPHDGDPIALRRVPCYRGSRLDVEDLRASE